MADIVYAFDQDAGVTTIAAESPAGDEWLGGHVTTIPNVELPAYYANAKAAGLDITPLPETSTNGGTLHAAADHALRRPS